MKIIGLGTLVVIFLILYIITAVIWGLLGIFILHEGFGLIALIIMLSECGKPAMTRKALIPILCRIRQWDLRMTAAATMFAIFGGLSLLVMLSVLDDEYSKES